MPSTFADFRRQWPAETFGVCVDNAPVIANYVNRATQRLIADPQQPDTGWWNTIVPMAFAVDPCRPYITLPRGIARIKFMDVCGRPVHVQNRFYQYLWAGVGLRENGNCCSSTWNTEAMDRDFHPTFADIPAGSPVFLQAQPTDPRDYGKRLLVQAYDQNGLKFYTQDVDIQVEGFYLVLDAPYVTSPWLVSAPLYGVQKDVTYGDVILSSVDQTTGVATELSRYEPGETRPAYRRYRINDMPRSCCGSTGGLVQVQVLAKRDYYPVAVDTDWLLIGNIEALIHECQSIRYGGMDTGNSKQMSQFEHQEAIRQLRGELDQYQGKEDVAVNVAPFGTARLQRQLIGSMM